MDFFGAGCAMWRREVFAEGLRFAPFFVGHGVLEDAHLALRAGRKWRLVECGQARCIHLRSPRARSGGRRLGRQSALNYRYVFIDLVRLRTWRQEQRFWTVQVLDLLRFSMSFLRRPSRYGAGLVVGKIEGIWAACWLRPESPRGVDHG